MPGEMLTPEEKRRRLEALVAVGKLDQGQVEQLMRAYEAQYAQQMARRKQEEQERAGRRSPRSGRGRGGTSGRAQEPQDNHPQWRNVKRHATSPYVFVLLNEQIVGPEDAWLDGNELKPRNEPLPDGCCAEIEVEWIPETPLLIGQKAARDESLVMPVKVNGQWIIPGASLRGHVRSILQTIAFGRLWPFNHNLRFGLRDFLHPAYSDAAIGKAQEAGWLQKTDDGYTITPCRSWGYISIEHLKNAGLFSGDWWKWNRKSREQKYSAAGYWDSQRKVFDFSQPRHAFRRAGNRKSDGRTIYELDESSPAQGYLVFSGPAPVSDKGPNRRTKRYEFVFFEDASARPVPVSADAWARFEAANARMVGNKVKKLGGWADFEETLKAGHRVPVFYVGDLGAQNETFAFGFTRMFKIVHKFTPGDMARRDNEGHVPSADAMPDFVENLFGFVRDESHAGKGDEIPARKGRVSFGMALPRGAFRESERIETIMGAPQPSFAPFYLRGLYKDWSSSDASLAGRKRYVPRFTRPERQGGPVKAMLRQQVSRAEETSRRGRVSDDVKIRLVFLEPTEGAKFVSRIRLFNVTRAELGALLWALTFGGETEKYRHMIGHARPFGAGQMRIGEVKLRIRSNDPRSGEWPGELGPYIQAFENYMEGRISGWRNSDIVQGYLCACDPSLWHERQDSLKYPQAFKPFQDLRKAVQLMKEASDPAAPRGALLPACPADTEK